MWELLPTSSLGGQAHSDPLLEPPPRLPLVRTGIGLSLACTTLPLTAPGPTGTRAEHITDMLSVPRRVHANKLHAALSALFCQISVFLWIVLSFRRATVSVCSRFARHVSCMAHGSL